MCRKVQRQFSSCESSVSAENKCFCWCYGGRALNILEGAEGSTRKGGTKTTGQGKLFTSVPEIKLEVAVPAL